MKIAIVYYSRHHGNTKKLLEAIAQKHEVTLLDVTADPPKDLSEYDLIGFASGIYYTKFHRGVLDFAKNNLPEDKSIFFLYTYGIKREGYTKSIRDIVQKKRAKIVGEYGCLGVNTFGPFKLIGGIAKDHPDSEDLTKAVEFFDLISHRAYRLGGN